MAQSLEPPPAGGRAPEDIIAEFEAEARTRDLSGWLRYLAGGLAILLSLYALYYATTTITAHLYRASFLLATLVLTFLYYPLSSRRVRGLWLLDAALIGLAVLAIGYVLWDFEEFIYRSTRPKPLDIAMGVITILLVLEATRRTTGWILPSVGIIFLLYAYVGRNLPPPWSHRGYDLDRIIGHTYMTLEGILGVPLDVAATFIILFTIYGAVLDASGAGKFFIDFSFAALGRKPTGAGRTVTLASFLMGTVSGSGVATTVTLGSIAYPLMRRAGYDAESAGGILAAGGIGAIISPPVLGAAAFLIAEFLKISYLQVLVMATMPTILYYLGIFLMIELDARRMGIKAVAVETPNILTLSLRYWYHFLSLFAVVGLMAYGLTPILSVFYATLLAVAVSYFRRDTALTPPKLAWALESGSRGVLSVAATTATAGIIVGVVTLTGLGLKLSGIIVDLAGQNLFLTLIFSSLAVWVLGLAVPITASYIIAAVMIAPALTHLGVSELAAHMFIFYYAVLSEVTPPTALAPFAAAAITGGNPYKTTMMAWKYTLPTFIVPFMFTIDPAGLGLLLQADFWTNVTVNMSAMVGLVLLLTGVGGWLLGPTNWLERALLIVGGLLLIYPTSGPEVIGFGVALGGVASQWWRFHHGKSLPPSPGVTATG